MMISIKSSMVVATLVAATTTYSSFHVNADDSAMPRHHVVEIQKFKFVPPSLTIRPGDTVEWINRDIVPHTATMRERAWNTGKLVNGQSAVVTPSSSGLQEYFCLFHPNMRGEIIVKAK